MSTALIIVSLFAAFLLGGLLVAEYLCRRAEAHRREALRERGSAPPDKGGASPGVTRWLAPDEKNPGG